MLSISKLAALAADEPDFRELKDIEAHLNLCSYQETLPQSLVDSLGLDMSTMGVLSQTQLIQVGLSNDYELFYVYFYLFCSYTSAMITKTLVLLTSRKHWICWSMWTAPRKRMS